MATYTIARHTSCCKSTNSNVLITIGLNWKCILGSCNGFSWNSIWKSMWPLLVATYICLWSKNLPDCIKAQETVI